MQGLVGVVGVSHAAELAARMARDQAHRAHNVGTHVTIVSYNGVDIFQDRVSFDDIGPSFDIKSLRRAHATKKGQVAEKQEKRPELDEIAAIAHVSRHNYNGHTSNIEPILARLHTDHSEENIEPQVAFALQGELHNYKAIKRFLERKGAVDIPEDPCQVGVLPHLMATLQPRLDFPLKSLDERLLMACGRLEGDFSVMMLLKDSLYVAQGHKGRSPLVWGVGTTERTKGGIFVASETSALEFVNARPHPVPTGAVTKFSPQYAPLFDLMNYIPHVKIQNSHVDSKPLPCTFFHQKPSSLRMDLKVSYGGLQEEVGRALARSITIPPMDLVTYLPASGEMIAQGFSEESNIPLRIAFDMDRRVTRHDGSGQGWYYHASVIQGVVEGKKVGLVDRGIVSGGTLARGIRKLKDAGADEVHVITGPLIRRVCPYRVIETPQEDLLANILGLTGHQEADDKKLRDYFSEATTMNVIRAENLVKQLPGCHSCY
ncbi:MAG: hypothetical protein AABX70_07475 [Nanoarchaeota archaeon]